MLRRWDTWDIRDIRDRRSIVGEVKQAGMIGGGVETTGGRDQFPGHFHTHQHFATGFAVVAGGLQNVGDGPGGVAVLQEAQDVYGFRSSWPPWFPPIVIEQTSVEVLMSL